MLFPVRCWTCGKVIGHLWEEFIETFNKSKLGGDDMSSIEWLFDELNIKRFCCHTIFLTHYQRYEEAIQMGFPEDFSG